MAASIRLMKKTGDTGDPPGIAAAGHPLFQPAQPGFSGAPVHGVGKQQGGIDIDAARDELGDRRQTLLRGGDFDHQIVAPHFSPQALCFDDGAGSVVCQGGRYFQRHIAVAAGSLLVHRQQQVGCGTNIRNGKPFKQCGRISGCVAMQAQILGISRIRSDGFLENGRI